MENKSNEKYHLKIVNIGNMAHELFQEGLLIFFGSEAPGELQEVSITHVHSELKEDVVPGDTIVIGDSTYTILCVGPVANGNLRELGHMVIKFNGLDTPENPGDINVETAELPDFSVGTELSIVDGEKHL